MRNLALLSALMATAALYTFYADFSTRPTQQENKSAQSASTRLESAPDFTFKDLSGKSHDLKDFKGKAIVLNFWAPWCAPCVAEFPQMVKLATATKKASVFLFLSVDEDKTKIETFIKKNIPEGLPDNVVIGTDRDMQISQKLFQTYALPETYLINSKGYISEKIIGMSIDWNSPEMYKNIDGLNRS